jgi:flagellar biosynthetic protein FliQ
MLFVGLMVGAPVIGASMLAGIVISIFQVVTQIQESSLTFVPKLLVIYLVLMLFGAWMLARLVEYSAHLFRSIPTLVQ